MNSQKLTRTLFTIVLIVGLLFYSKTFLIPIILAIVLWYLINAVSESLKRIPKLGQKLPDFIWLTLSSVTIFFLLFSIGGLIGQTINNMASAAPDYQVNLDHQIQRLAHLIGYEREIDLALLVSNIDMNKMLGSLLNSFKSLAQSFFMVLLYTLFLLFEQQTFPRKIAALRMDKERKDSLSKMFTNINISVRKYIGVKFLASLSTGVFSYVVIQYAGLDFALFWAFVIFVFNFIPTIGSIVATFFPSLIALVQFETLTPFFIILIGVGLIQILIGVILEPKFYGNSLNISPLVIVISLVFWGQLWGIVGMLLCVPITVIMINVFAQFTRTRPIAVLLSQNGKLPAE